MRCLVIPILHTHFLEEQNLLVLTLSGASPNITVMISEAVLSVYCYDNIP